MRGIYAVLLSILILTSTILPLVDAADTVTTGDAAMSGTVVLDGNYTVSAGDTLTIAAGTTLDAKNYWILVEGSLVATDAMISSSTQGSGQGGASAGVWDGIIIAPDGDAVLDGVTISDARTCINVNGRLDANDLTLSHCLIGMELYGTANLTGLSGNDLQSGGIRSTGTLNITDSSISNTSMAISSTGNLDVDNLDIIDSGAGIYVTAGSATIDNLNVVNLSMGLHVEDGVSGYMTGMTGERNVLAIDAGDSSNFPFQDISLGAERLLQAWNSGDISVSNAQINGSFDSERAAIDIVSDADISFTDISLTNVTHGIDITGAGDYTFNNLIITTSGIGIQASGDLSLDINTMAMEAEQAGMLLSEIQGEFTDSTINISDGGDNGVEILFGDYVIDNMEINKPYNSQEHNSIGMHAWLANSITVSNQMKISGFATGLRLEDGKMTIDDLAAGLSEDICIDLINGDLIITGSLSTNAATLGITLGEESTIVVASWASEYHTNGINIGQSSTAAIRAWTVFSTAADDATGSGTLYHPYIDFANIAASLDAAVLTETAITITDLSDVGIPAVVEVHGFTETAAADGTITIPLTSGGSMVTATHQNIGASDSLSSGVSSQVLRVPIIPDGDWTISAGQSVVLSAPSDGSSHVAGGDIWIESGGSLFLQGSTLDLDGYVLRVYGEFGGDEGTLAGGDIGIYYPALITNTGSLTIKENLVWILDSYNYPSAVAETTGLIVEGDFEILDLMGPQGGTVKITDGEVQGTVTIQSGNELQIHTSLQVTVLDKGEPVEGATVNVNGNIANTDTTGIVVYSTASRTVNNDGEQWAGRLNVSVNSGNLPEMFTWDTNYSMNYQFMASTITQGPISEWMVLERAWSPYHLQGDLTIPSGETLTIKDGVHLRVSDGYSIIVEGTADVGSAVITSIGNSARWGGFDVGYDADTALYLTGTQVAEAAPGITMSGLSRIDLQAVLITRSGSSDPLIRTTAAASGTIDIIDSELNQGGSSCIESQGTIILTMNNVELESCSGAALWAQGIEVDITGLEIGNESSIGLDLSAVSGMIADVDTTLHDGVNVAIRVNLAEELQLSDLNLSAPQDAALSITNSKNVDINGLNIITSPGIEMDSTTGEFDDMVIDCGGSGTAISIASLRTSGTLSLADSEISSCDTGIEVTSVSDYNSAVRFSDLEIVATIALSVDGADIYIEDGTFTGELQCANAIVDLVDIEPTTTTVSSGEVWLWNSHIIQATLYGDVVSASFSIDNGEGGWSTEFSGSSTELLIPYAIISSSGRSEYTAASFTISAEGASSMTQTLTVGPTVDDIITIILTANSAPSVVILTPSGESNLMEGGYFTASAEVSDDISPLDNLIITWTLSDDIGVLVEEQSGLTVNFTNLEPGTFLLTLSAEDQQGVANSTSVTIEVSLLDSDGDWIDTCNDATWFDSLLGIHCGPDVYDENDDNDDYSDAQDQWPTDPCAALDTDNDGQPNIIDCPEGHTTLLVEDQDDDNDGTPDILEGAVSSQDESSSSITLILGIGVIVILAGIIFSRMRKEE
jgi:hypothetical protein